MKNTGLVLLATASAFNAATAQAAVTISSGPTSNMTCSAGVCTPTAADAVLNAGDLEGLLASGNLKVTTTGARVQANDIRIAAPIAWSSATTLSLDAYKSIAIGKPVTVSGSGGVSLVTNDGGTSGEFSVSGKGRVTFQTLSGTLTINGAAYALVRNVTELAAAIAANPSGNFALAKNCDASRDGTYATPPVPTVFNGAFNGLGNTISNLTINDPTENAYVGVFAEIVSGATLANIRLANENVTGGSGSSISDSTEFIGGLVGYANGGTFAEIFATGVVTGGDYASVGGLVGIGGGALRSSGTAMSVSNGGLGNAGGLVGGTGGGPVVDSYATGNVSGTGFVGGLVGFNAYSPIIHSYAAGQVTSNDQGTYVGGLTGMNDGSAIDRSFSTGAVTCQFVCGGLVGINGAGGATSTISQSYATGSVSSSEGAGGLVGYNMFGAVSDSYAMDGVSAQTSGGLVGENVNQGTFPAIARSYAAGAVTGTAGTTGGLIGYDEFASGIKHAYWDTTTSGIANLSQGAGNVSNDPGIKGLTTAQFQSGLPKGFGAKIWTENPDINGGLPYLTANPPVK